MATSINPHVTDTSSLGTSSLKWKNAYFSGTVTVPTLAGNVDVSTGSSTFNNVSINGTLSASNLSGNADTATDLSINATQRLLIQTGNNATEAFPSGTNNYVLTSSGNGSAPTWEQDFAGNAASATEVYVNEYTNDSTQRPILFAYTSNTANSGNRAIGKDHTHLTWHGQENMLRFPNITLSETLDADNVQANTFGTSSQNAYGARTVGTGNPTGGSNGDIYYKY